MAYLADSKLYRTMDMPDAHSFLQNDLDSLNNWSREWSMEFNPTKKVTHWSWQHWGTTVLIIDNLSGFPPLRTLVLLCPATFHGQGILKTSLRRLTKLSALSKEYAGTSLSPPSENFYTVSSWDLNWNKPVVTLQSQTSKTVRRCPA